VHGESGLLDEVPDLVEYPSVIAGTFASEFTEVLPDEVLTTTLIHHQHYFPVEDEDGKLKPAFLAVINTEPDNERTIARNAERVVTARLRDAMFFWETDRRVRLEARIDRLSTLLFHKRLGTYKDKAERIERLAAWIAREVFEAPHETVAMAALAGRLAKADLTTDMVREFTELQGTMGGIYARHEGLPDEVWKAIHFHYLPVGVEAAAAPTRAQLGNAAVTWASTSLADKLDTIVGLFAAGERPTGSRDPYGLRRAAQGVIKILADFARLSSSDGRTGLPAMMEQARFNYGQSWPASSDGWEDAVAEFFTDRQMHVFERRGFRIDEMRAVVPGWWQWPHSSLKRLEALAAARTSADIETLATLFKRVKNITKDFEGELTEQARARLVEPAEAALLKEIDSRWPAVEAAVAAGRFAEAIRELRALSGPVDRFFVDVLVMTDDPEQRYARLALLTALRRTILNIGDISEIAPAEAKPAEHV
jgi:glycyl-tRNA synthetase beta chain